MTQKLLSSLSCFLHCHNQWQQHDGQQPAAPGLTSQRLAGSNKETGQSEEYGNATDLCSSSSGVVPIVARSQICWARAGPTKGRRREAGCVPGWTLNAHARMMDAALAKLSDCGSKRSSQTKRLFLQVHI